MELASNLWHVALKLFPPPGFLTHLFQSVGTYKFKVQGNGVFNPAFEIRYLSIFVAFFGIFLLPLLYVTLSHSRVTISYNWGKLSSIKKFRNFMLVVVATITLGGLHLSGLWEVKNAYCNCGW